MASNISSSSSHTSLLDSVVGSTDVDVSDAPGRPLEYGETFPKYQFSASYFRNVKSYVYMEASPLLLRY